MSFGRRKACVPETGDLSEARKIDVAYTDGHWLAEVAPDFDEPFDCESLAALIAAVRQAWPDEALLFVVDQSTVEGYADAEAQLLEASEQGTEQVISSVQEF